MGSLQNTITIRPAFAGEADFLSALALRSKAHWDYSRQFLEACRDELQYTAQQIVDSGYSFAVAELDGVVVGFYAIERLSATEYELEALFVEPLHIGRGIGRALMDHAKRDAQAKGGEVLVIQSDPHAERFYLAAGALPTGQRESASIPGRYLPMLAIRLQKHTSQKLSEHPVNIRVAQQEDIETLFEIRTSVVENHQSREEIAALGITPASVAEMLQADCCAWIAELSGQSIGFSIANATEKTIFGLFILPAFEGRGAGRALMQAAENWLWSKAIEEIWLVTGNDPNLRAYGFYQHLDWVPVGVESDGMFKGEMKFIKKLQTT